MSTSQSPLPKRRRDRAQTAQDYALGISIFLLVLSFVIGYFPSLLEPYDSGAGAAESATGNRVSQTIISEVGSGRAPNDINSTLAATYFTSNLSSDEVRKNLSLSEDTFVNVTVKTLNRSSLLEVTDPSGTPIALAGGHTYQNESAVTVSRVITMRDDLGACRPACRIVVRVW